MSFNLDAAIGASPKPFRFTWGGQEFELPTVLALPIDKQLAIMEAAESLGDNPPARQVVALVDLIMDAEFRAALSAVKPLTTPAMMALLNAWMDSSGEDLGKSPASARSSASTGKPSKRISRSTALRMTN